MLRRRFLRLVAFTTAALAIPIKWATASTPITIERIIAVSWTHVVETLKDGLPWYSIILNGEEHRGRLKRQALGAVYEHNGIIYPIEEVRVSCLWSSRDDEQNPSENQRIRLCKNMMVNCVRSHDDLLKEALEEHDLVVSEQCRYLKGATWEYSKPDGSKEYYFMVYAAIVKLPKGSLTC